MARIHPNPKIHSTHNSFARDKGRKMEVIKVLIFKRAETGFRAYRMPPIIPKKRSTK
jgi:hypothetical protein